MDIEAGDRAVELMRAAVARTARPEVIGGIGGFAGLFDASKLAGYRRPVLATATDGVGTKVTIAQRVGRYGTVGQDLVAMVVDDLVVCGAEPLFMTDYVVCGRVHPERVAAIVTGVAEGCVLAGCALLGGETAEHPGHLGPDDFDLAGAATGVVEADRLLGPDRVRPGDVLIAMASSGLHSNGFSLVRKVIDEPGRELPLDRDPGGLGRTLGDELLEPTRIYALDCLALADACEVHAFAHITGGGLAANLSRVLPPGAGATLDRGTWRAAGGVRAAGPARRYRGRGDGAGLQPGHRDDRGGRAGRGRARARAAGRAGGAGLGGRPGHRGVGGGRAGRRSPRRGLASGRWPAPLAPYP